MEEERRLCPNCKKEIFPEAHFCPYCMTRFVESNHKMQQYPAKKRRKKWFILGMAGVILIMTVAGITVGVFLGREGQKKTQKEEKTVEQKVEKEELDYSKYIGEWYDEIKDTEDPRQAVQSLGGTCLEIMSMDEDSVFFNLYTYQSPPASRVAFIENITAVFSEDKKEANFLFTEDGFGNSGSGVISFQGDTVYVITNLSYESPVAMWSVRTDTSLVKSNLMQNGTGAIKGSLTSLDVVKYKFGKEIKKVDYYEGPVYYYEYATVYTTEGNVTKVVVDYTQLDEKGKQIVKYDSIGYNSTPDAIFNKFSGLSESGLDEYQTGPIYCREGGKDNHLIDFIYQNGQLTQIIYHAQSSS